MNQLWYFRIQLTEKPKNMLRRCLAAVTFIDWMQRTVDGADKTWIEQQLLSSCCSVAVQLLFSRWLLVVTFTLYTSSTQNHKSMTTIELQEERTIFRTLVRNRGDVFRDARDWRLVCPFSEILSHAFLSSDSERPWVLLLHVLRSMSTDVVFHLRCHCCSAGCEVWLLTSLWWCFASSQEKTCETHSLISLFAVRILSSCSGSVLTLTLTIVVRKLTLLMMMQTHRQFMFEFTHRVEKTRMTTTRKHRHSQSRKDFSSQTRRGLTSNQSNSLTTDSNQQQLSLKQRSCVKNLRSGCTSRKMSCGDYFES